MSKTIRALTLLYLCLMLAACGSGEAARVAVFALEGPPLAIAGVQKKQDEPGELNFTGEMERSCMVGSGYFKLTNLESGDICQGKINSGPTNQGRIRGLVACGEMRFLLLTMSNQGPDQGVGVGRFAKGITDATEEEQKNSVQPNLSALELDIEAGDPLLFYYHPWIDEAQRRLTDVQENINVNLQRQNLQGQTLQSKPNNQHNPQPQQGLEP